MEVGLFLDIDGVLTDKAVNMQYAQLLNVENKLKALEKKWAKGTISNAAFNDAFIPLFRAANFSRDYAHENFSNIQMRQDATNLLSVTPDTTFIVTSGPSYFVDRLAKEWNIPNDHVICSRYVFDHNGLLCDCTEPSTRTKKAHFVQERAKKFEVSIGVGDSEQDTNFLNHCTVRIMMSPTHHDYLLVTQLQPIIDLIQQFRDVTDLKFTVGHLIKDSELRSRCEDILNAKANFDRAITVVTQTLEDRLRTKARASKKTIGEDLVNFAFNEQLEKTLLKVESGAPQDQRGFTRLLRGVVPAFRNPSHHYIQDVSREDAVRIAAFIDLLLQVVDKSVMVTRSAPASWISEQDLAGR